MAYYGHSRKNYQQRNKRRKQAQDWHKSEFNNPYFEHQQPINLKPYLYFCLFICLFFSLGYGLLFSQFLNIKSINIIGQQQNDAIKKITNQYLDGRWFNLFSKKNYFLFNPNQLKEELSSQLSLKKVAVEKKLPDQVTVTFENIKPAFIWTQPNNFFYVDQDGLVSNKISSLFKPDPNKEISDIDNVKSFLTLSDANLGLPIIYNTQNNDLLTQGQLQNKQILEIVKQLDSQLSTIIRTSVILYQISDYTSLNRLEVVTEDNWRIYFQADSSIDEQLKNLNSLMQKEFKDSKPTEYIDLRYGNKLYYK